MYITDATLPRAYGAFKVHKLKDEYRIIVSTIDRPLYALTSVFQKILKKNLIPPNGTINNIIDLKNKLKNITTKRCT